jgi:hypothetical protein
LTPTDQRLFIETDESAPEGEEEVDDVGFGA